MRRSRITVSMLALVFCTAAVAAPVAAVPEPVDPAHLAQAAQPAQPAHPALPAPPSSAPAKPSRAAVDGCQWQKRNDRAIGLRSWVQHCDYGDRKIDFLVVGQSLAVRYSDGGGTPDAVVDVIDLVGDETAAQGLTRVYAARTEPAVAARCELGRWRGDWPKTPAGVERYTFKPNAAYATELAKTQDPNEVNDPACGPFGATDDGIQYFEVQPASRARRVLFVRVGQDEPLFDDATLTLIAPAG